MHIIYTLDDNFAMQTGVSLTSLLMNNKNAIEINVHIISHQLSLENKLRLEKCIKDYKRNVFFYNQSGIEKYSKKLYITDNWSLATYLRLFVVETLPIHVERAIYIDSDTLIMNSIEPFWETEFLENKMVCGVTRDNYRVVNKNHYKYLNLNEDDVYINAGILLMDINSLRKINITDRYIKFMESYDFIFPCVDQDVINGTLKGKIQRIAPEYNVVTPLFMKGGKEIAKMNFAHDKEYYNQILRSMDFPVILHFTGGRNTPYRPWYKGSLHPYTEQWREIKSKTVWRDTALKPLPKGFRMFLRWLFRKLPTSIYIAYFKLKCNKRFFNLDLYKIRKKINK
ncbi:MAG: glycosyltransferase family 8 protein [Lachnospiraceae bacterium]|nr:glycosyltransferase family 8 protein [Lachnospiraceae bacterium]